MDVQGKNIEIEHAVGDLVKIIKNYQVDDHVDKVSPDEILKLKRHYNHFMYQALLHCAKNSMNTLKKRIASRSGSITNLLIKPFFEVNVHLTPPLVILQVRSTAHTAQTPTPRPPPCLTPAVLSYADGPQPSLDEIQDCINKSAQAILRCFSKVQDWSLDEAEENGVRGTFFERVTKDIEIVRVALLLTGCIQGTIRPPGLVAQDL
jgi:dynein heavy chain, axonemal